MRSERNNQYSQEYLDLPAQYIEDTDDYPFFVPLEEQPDVWTPDISKKSDLTPAEISNDDLMQESREISPQDYILDRGASKISNVSDAVEFENSTQEMVQEENSEESVSYSVWSNQVWVSL